MRRLAAGWSPLTGVMILFAAGCDVAPTGPTIQAPAAAAPTENHGNGAQFVIVEGFTNLIVLIDDEGNVCDIGFSQQEGPKARSDFFRFNPDGSISIHTSDPDAPLIIEYQGQVYEGVGHA